jgi:hypothetical protein
MCHSFLCSFVRTPAYIYHASNTKEDASRTIPRFSPPLSGPYILSFVPRNL